jgi:hypothetical protein
MDRRELPTTHPNGEAERARNTRTSTPPMMNPITTGRIKAFGIVMKTSKVMGSEQNYKGISSRTRPQNYTHRNRAGMGIKEHHGQLV